jgi:tripartite motif-containing protein 71
MMTMFRGLVALISVVAVAVRPYSPDHDEARAWAAESVDCVRFDADVTIPDGTEMAPGQSFDKVWRLVNCGATNWELYRAVRLGGSFGPPTIDVPPTGPGQTAEISGKMQAPDTPGGYRVYYMLEGSGGRFGGPFYVEIRVAEPEGTGLESDAGLTPPPAGQWQVLAGDHTAPGTFNGPTGLAIDADGNVYVADSGNHRVQKLSTDGHPLAQWGAYGAAPGEFRAPSAVAVADDGSLYIADTGNRRVQKLGASGEPLAEWSTPESRYPVADGPTDVAVDEQGNVYVADPYNHAVHKINASTGEMTLWATLGESQPYAGPDSVAYANGRVYVIIATDTGRGRLVQLSATGDILAQTPSGPGELTPDGLTDVTVDPEGAVTVDPEGAVTVDPEGAAYAISADQTHVLRLALDGGISQRWDLPANQRTGRKGLALDATGNLLLANPDDHLIHKLSTDGPEVAVWGAVPITISALDSFAVDSQGAIYLSDVASEGVRKLSSDGAMVAELRLFASTVPATPVAASGLAVGPEDSLYVTNMSRCSGFFGLSEQMAVGPCLLKVSAKGDTIAEWGKFGRGPGEFNDPSALAVDRQGNVYVADQFNARVQKLDSAGKPLAQWKRFGTGPKAVFLPGGFGLAVDQHGNLWVADSTDDTVRMLSPTGELLALWGMPGKQAGQFNSPMSVTVDIQGKVYVADAGNNRIQVFSSDGVPLAQWAGAGTAPGKFLLPSQVAVDGQGDLYVLDVGNLRLQKFTPSR